MPADRREEKYAGWRDAVRRTWSRGPEARGIQKMTVKVAINGFGRIGRNVLRAIVESGRTDIEVIALNDLGPVETNAHLMRYDSVHGRFPGTVTVSGDTIDVGRGPIRVTAERDPKALPWGDVDIALECTGIFTDRPKAALHLENGSKRVLVSAPVGRRGQDHRLRRQRQGADQGRPRRLQRLLHHQLPRARRLRAAQGDRDRQGLHDHDPQLYRRPADARHHAQGPLPRAAPPRCRMIPTSTGAAKAVGLVLPELNGKLDGVSIRVPTPNVSVVDFKFIASRPTSRRGDQRGDQGRRPRASSRASSATPPRSSSRRTSTTTAIPRSSTWTRPR